MAAVTAVSRLLRASPPFVGADSISARGTPRRRGVPGWLPRSSHSVGRAFTPAAHWQFQNRALPRREHPREVHGPPLRTGTDATAIRLARNIKFIRRGGIYPARGRSRRRRVRRDEGIPPYGALRQHGFAVGRGGVSVLPPLLKGGGTAAGRDGGIALRLAAV